MTRRLALALLPLAACATATPDPQVGSVSHGGDTYAIHASAGDPSVWKLVIDGQTVLAAPRQRGIATGRSGTSLPAAPRWTICQAEHRPVFAGKRSIAPARAQSRSSQSAPSR